MNYIAKRLPKISIYFLAVILISGWFFFGRNAILTLADNSTSTPEVSLTTPSEEIATTTPEIATTTPEIATTTPEIATTTPEIATSSLEIATSSLEIPSTVATTTPETATSTVLTATPDILPLDEPTGNELAASADLDDSANLTAAANIETITPPPPLKERKFTKIVRFGKNTAHKCGMETFKIDLSGKTSASARIVLQKGARLEPEEIEIGSLPVGIDITFSKNSDYIYRPAQNETVLNLQITNEAGSQKGNFSIPIIYTKNGSSDSTTECQINVINF